MSERKLNDWCQGIKLADGKYSGCTCDCPTCAETAKKLAALELNAVALACLSDTLLACCMYTAYCNAVGGKAYNGDPLPDWDTLTKDPTKQKIVTGWYAAVSAVRPKLV